MNLAICHAGGVLAAVLGVAAVRACRFAWLVRRAHRICDACAFEPGHRPPSATRRLLVVGDSTAMGIGAQVPSETLVGRIAAQFPSTLVENHARMGARAADMNATDLCDGRQLRRRVDRHRRQRRPAGHAP